MKEFSFQRNLNYYFLIVRKNFENKSYKKGFTLHEYELYVPIILREKNL